MLMQWMHTDLFCRSWPSKSFMSFSFWVGISLLLRVLQAFSQPGVHRPMRWGGDNTHTSSTSVLQFEGALKSFQLSMVIQCDKSFVGTFPLHVHVGHTEGIWPIFSLSWISGECSRSHYVLHICNCSTGHYSLYMWPTFSLLPSINVSNCPPPPIPQVCWKPRLNCESKHFELLSP